MNHRDTRSRAQLIDWIDFKWLMASEGCHLDVERLQRDHGYAQHWVAFALQSPTALLRRVALKLQRPSNAAG
ncbi:MAG: hypothetical protein HY855_03995 [Burkholderiales bacterium]|nr:hypothetical protein [Burkholderiales bacterium]